MLRNPFNSIFIFEHLINATENDISYFIKQSTDNSEEFKTFIDNLLQDYYTTLLSPELRQNDLDVIALGKRLQNKFAELKSDLDQLKNQAKLSNLLLPAQYTANKAKKMVRMAKIDAETAEKRLTVLQNLLDKISEEKLRTELQEEINNTINEFDSAKKATELANIEKDAAKARVQKLLNTMTNLPEPWDKELLNDHEKATTYQTTEFQIGLFKDNIKPHLDTIHGTLDKELSLIATHCEALNEAVDDIGVKNIQKCLAVCIEIFMNMPYPAAAKVDYYQNYCSIAKSLAEFWYDEGMQLISGEDLLKPESEDLKKGYASLVSQLI